MRIGYGALFKLDHRRSSDSLQLAYHDKKQQKEARKLILRFSRNFHRGLRQCLDRSHELQERKSVQHITYLEEVKSLSKFLNQCSLALQDLSETTSTHMQEEEKSLVFNLHQQIDYLRVECMQYLKLRIRRRCHYLSLIDKLKDLSPKKVDRECKS